MRETEGILKRAECKERRDRNVEEEEDVEIMSRDRKEVVRSHCIWKTGGRCDNEEDMISKRMTESEISDTERGNRAIIMQSGIESHSTSIWGGGRGEVKKK